MAFADLLIETFTRRTLTKTSDGQGGVTEAWADESTFAGRLSILSARERMLQDKETAYSTFKVFCLASVTINEEDRIALGSRTFEILGIQKPSNLSTGHLEILVLEVD